MKKFLAILMAAILVVLAFAGCSKVNNDDSSDNDPSKTAGTGVDDPSNAAGDSSIDPNAGVGDLAYVKDKGVLVVGITEFKPMDYQDANGNWIGFDADMAKAFAESLGVEVEFQITDWDNKHLELKSKAIDCVWNGMTLTNDVKALMSCSEPYCNNAQIVIIAADKADQYKTVESMKGLTFAVENGSAGKEAAEENGFDFIEVADQATTLMEVKSGAVDAAIIDSLMAAAMVGEGTDYDNLTYTLPLTTEEYGVGFRTGSDLTAALNQFLKDCAADGSLQATAEKYGIEAALIK